MQGNTICRNDHVGSDADIELARVRNVVMEGVQRLQDFRGRDFVAAENPFFEGSQKPLYFERIHLDASPSSVLESEFGYAAEVVKVDWRCGLLLRFRFGLHIAAGVATPNTALKLCDEVERLRERLAVAAQLAEALDGGGLTTHARMDLMRHLQTVCSGRAPEIEPEAPVNARALQRRKNDQ